MEKKYNTRHGESVSATVKSFNGAHFTAEEFLLKSRERGENMGLSTVYRQLDKLVKNGSIRKFSSSAGESACYQEINTNCDHFHLRCVKCGKLEHLSCTVLASISQHVELDHGFKIDPSKTVFYGVCKECGEN